MSAAEKWKLVPAPNVRWRGGPPIARRSSREPPPFCKLRQPPADGRHHRIEVAYKCRRIPRDDRERGEAECGTRAPPSVWCEVSSVTKPVCRQKRSALRRKRERRPCPQLGG